MAEAGPDIVLRLGDLALRLTRTEVAHYAQLFAIVDSDRDGFIAGREGSWFLRRSKLSQVQLRDVWHVASNVMGEPSPRLTQEQWYVALKLTALAQQFGTVDVELLYQERSGEPPLPEFYLDDAISFDELASDGESAVLDLGDDVIAISVAAPELVGQHIHAHYRYAVTTETTLTCYPRHTMAVSRRFREFEWLHERIVHKYAGTIVPPLPAKRLFGGRDPDFLDERRSDLQHYINRLARHPQLAQSLELILFLDCSRAGLEAIMAMTKPSGDAWISGAWSSVKSWVGLATPPPPPVDSGSHDEYRTIDASMSKYKEEVQSCVDAADKVVKAEKGRAYEVARIGCYISLGAEYERLHEDTYSFMTTLGRQLEQLSNEEQDVMDSILDGFFTPLKYQLGKVGAVKEVMRNRERALAELRTASSTLKQSKKAHAAARAAGKSSTKSRAAEKGIVESEGRIQSAEEKIQFITKNLSKEMAKFRRDKHVEFRDLLLALATKEKQRAATLRSGYVSMLKAIAPTREQVEASRARIEAEFSPLESVPIGGVVGRGRAGRRSSGDFPKSS